MVKFDSSDYQNLTIHLFLSNKEAVMCCSILAFNFLSVSEVEICLLVLVNVFCL